MTSGIYSITNVHSGKTYYGSSNHIEKRWKGHKSKLRKGFHPNPHLQSSWNKYGENSFIFQVEEKLPVKKLQEVEQYYLDWCKLFPFWSYNIEYDAEAPTRGVKFGPPSEEHRKKIGLANSGINSPNYGKHLSEETRQRMSRARRGISKPPRTEEHKRNLSLACKGENNYRYDHTVYTFYHPNYGTKKCNRHDLVKMYNLNERGIGYVISRERKHHKEWRLL
jgi:group I intron endonuclease